MDFIGKVIFLLMGAGFLFAIQQVVVRFFKLKPPRDVQELLKKERQKERKERENEIEGSAPGDEKVKIFNASMNDWRKDRHSE